LNADFSFTSTGHIKMFILH